MHHDFGLCWIGHGELSAALPLHYEREHAGAAGGAPVMDEEHERGGVRG